MGKSPKKLASEVVTQSPNPRVPFQLPRSLRDGDVWVHACLHLVHASLRTSVSQRNRTITYPPKRLTLEKQKRRLAFMYPPRATRPLHLPRAWAALQQAKLQARQNPMA